MLKKPILMFLQAIATLAATGCLSYPGEEPLDLIATPIVGGVITSTIAVLVLLPVLFMTLKERQLRRGTLRTSQGNRDEELA